jgi:hypothetical protein
MIKWSGKKLKDCFKEGKPIWGIRIETEEFDEDVLMEKSELLSLEDILIAKGSETFSWLYSYYIEW